MPAVHRKIQCNGLFICNAVIQMFYLALRAKGLRHDDIFCPVFKFDAQQRVLFCCTGRTKQCREEEGEATHHVFHFFTFV